MPVPHDCKKKILKKLNSIQQRFRNEGKAEQSCQKVKSRASVLCLPSELLAVSFTLLPTLSLSSCGISHPFPIQTFIKIKKRKSTELETWVLKAKWSAKQTVETCHINSHKRSVKLFSLLYSLYSVYALKPDDSKICRNSGVEIPETHLSNADFSGHTECIVVINRKGSEEKLF